MNALWLGRCVLSTVESLILWQNHILHLLKPISSGSLTNKHNMIQFRYKNLRVININELIQVQYWAESFLNVDKVNSTIIIDTTLFAFVPIAYSTWATVTLQQTPAAAHYLLLSAANSCSQPLTAAHSCPQLLTAAPSCSDLPAAAHSCIDNIIARSASMFSVVVLD